MYIILISINYIKTDLLLSLVSLFYEGLSRKNILVIIPYYQVSQTRKKPIIIGLRCSRLIFEFEQKKFYSFIEKKYLR